MTPGMDPLACIVPSVPYLGVATTTPLALLLDSVSQIHLEG